MQINKVELKNFRCFEHLEFEPHSNLNVILGINGSGKTAILSAIALVFDHYLSIMTNYEQKTKLDDVDINNSSDAAAIEIEVKNAFSAKVKDKNWVLGKTRGNAPTFDTSYRGWENEYLLRGNDSFMTMNLPVFKFYNSKIPLKEASKIRIASRGEYVYKNSFTDASPFQFFKNWFIQEEEIEKREIFEKKDFDHTNRNLNWVRYAINQVFSSLNCEGIRTKTNEETRETEIVLEKNEQTVSYTQLSEGEKTMLLMFADIARRMTIANPNAENPLLGNGVVLIDEIELHLHPSWQRTIVPNLNRVFPNIQFFITSHSPLVISNLSPLTTKIFIVDGGIVTLHDNTEFNPYGAYTSTVLQKMMGTNEQPIEVSEKIASYFNKIHSNKLDEAEAIQNELEELIDKNTWDIIQGKNLIKSKRFVQNLPKK